MLTIKITDNLSVRVEEKCYTLIKTRKVEKSKKAENNGKDYEQTMGYFSNLKHLAEVFSQLYLEGSRKRNIELSKAFEIMTEGIDKLYAHIDELIDERRDETVKLKVDKDEGELVLESEIEGKPEPKKRGRKKKVVIMDEAPSIGFEDDDLMKMMAEVEEG